MNAPAVVSLDQARSRRVARVRSGPAHIHIEKRVLVEFCMDAQTLTRELMSRNAEVIRRLARAFPEASAERQYVLDATHAVHEKAVAALNEWLAATDRYEHTPPVR
jgi:hypothetical protein